MTTTVLGLVRPLTVFELQKSDEYLPLMTQIFGVEKEQMRTWLCNRKIVTAQESVVKPLTVQQVRTRVCVCLCLCL